MTDYLTTDTDLTSVANAIRTKGGTSAQLSFPTGFVSAINAIPTGGGGGTWSDVSSSFTVTNDDDSPISGVELAAFSSGDAVMLYVYFDAAALANVTGYSVYIYPSSGLYPSYDGEWNSNWIYGSTTIFDGVDWNAYGFCYQDNPIVASDFDFISSGAVAAIISVAYPMQ